MIRAVAVRSEGRVVEFSVKGHAGYAKFNKDIVCAAVSATVQTALLGLLNFSKETVDYTVGDDGYLRFAVPNPDNLQERERLDTIVETMLLGLKDIESGYASYLKVEER